MPSTPWIRAELQSLTDQPEDPATWTAPFPDGGVPRVLPDIDFWDLWPVRTADGAVADVCGSPVWAGLSAPASGHPGLRHDSARIRLVQWGRGGWADLGPMFPEGASSGSREWAGSLVFDPASQLLVGYYTAAGERGEQKPTFRQRIMSTSTSVQCAKGRPVLGPWSAHQEVIAADGVHYRPANEATGEPGFIKAFRDPFPVVDPASGASYLLFTASMAHSATDFDGCIGIARNDHADGWRLLDPLITADGVNNELERPHVVIHDGRYYLFFSTQQRTFHPDVIGPTGLYGFVGDALLGPYRPLNRSGLVLRNPPAEPFQAYSWLVLDDLLVTGFVDAFALHGTHPDDLERQGADAVRRHFGGTMTPAVRLGLDGARAWIAIR